MPLILTPQCVEAKLVMSQGGVPIINRWYVDVAASPTPAILALVAGVIDAWVTSDYASQISNTVAFEQIICTDFSVNNGAQDISTPTTATGAATGAAVAANAALVASLRTQQTGRNYRGRTYTPGMVAGHVSDAQHATTGHATAINTAFANLVAAMVTAGYKLCILSQYLNNALRAVGLLTEVVSIITNTKIDSQRRRTAN